MALFFLSPLLNSISFLSTSTFLLLLTTEAAKLAAEYNVFWCQGKVFKVVLTAPLERGWRSPPCHQVAKLELLHSIQSLIFVYAGIMADAPILLLRTIVIKQMKNKSLCSVKYVHQCGILANRWPLLIFLQLLLIVQQTFNNESLNPKTSTSLFPSARPYAIHCEHVRVCIFYISFRG